MHSHLLCVHYLPVHHLAVYSKQDSEIELHTPHIPTLNNLQKVREKCRPLSGCERGLKKYIHNYTYIYSAGFRIERT